MPTISATVYPDEAYVLVEADWTDQPTVEYARVVRVNTATGEEVLLRPYIAYNAGGDLLLNCGLGLWWDTEPPLDVPLVYRTEAADVAVILNVNSSFETGTAPWVAFGGVLTQSAVFSHEGTFSGLITPTGGGASALVRQSPVPITAGLPVTASLWVLSPQGWNAANLTFSWTDGAAFLPTTGVQTVREIIDDGEWRFLTFTASPPPQADGLALDFSATSPPATTLFYLDQFQVTQQLPLGVTAQTAPVTVIGDDRFFLKDPLNPCHDLELALCISNPRQCEPVTPGVMIQSYGPQESYQPNTVLLEPVNRRHPIPVNRVRRDASSLLTVMTRTCDDRDAVLLLNEPGTALFFQAPGQYCISDRYVTVGAVTVERLVPDHRIQVRRITLPHALVDRPDGPANGVCGARFRDLCDIYLSWGSMNLAGLTYEDLLLGLASPSGPGQPPISSLRTWNDVLTEFADWNDVDNGVRTWSGLLNGL
jgi:Carbohydrate binding domain